MERSFRNEEDGFGKAAQLTAPEFILSVLLLLANDFFLKAWLANGFTGKLSDFAGLFAFPFFWAALMPRWRVSIYLGTAVAFTFWKLPVSEGLIAGGNAVSPLQVGRVIDASDLIALSILPLSYWRSTRPRQIQVRRWRTVGLAAVSLFAFVATSREPAYQYDQTFVFKGSRELLFVRLEEAGIIFTEGTSYYQRAPKGSWGLLIPSNFCSDGEPVEAAVMIAENGSRTTVRLRGMAHRCRAKPGDDEKLLEVFVAKVVEPLGMVRQQWGEARASGLQSPRGAKFQRG
jgi:hypothetical protein